MKHHGNLIVALTNGQVLSATSVEVFGDTACSIAGFRQNYSVERRHIGKVWRLNEDKSLPADAVKHHTQLAAALIAMEQELATYEKEKGHDPLVHSQGPLIFGAAALTLTINKERSSEDIDYIVSRQFAEWAQDRGTLNAELDVDLADESIPVPTSAWKNWK